MLHKAIISFNEAKNKTFTRYFELILKRRFWALLKRLPKYVIKDIPEIQGSYILRETEIVIPDLKSKLELDIFEMYFVNNESISDISKKRGYKVKQIYNAIYRIREKILSK